MNWLSADALLDAIELVSQCNVLVNLKCKIINSVKCDLCQ